MTNHKDRESRHRKAVTTPIVQKCCKMNLRLSFRWRSDKVLNEYFYLYFKKHNNNWKKNKKSYRRRDPNCQKLQNLNLSLQLQEKKKIIIRWKLKNYSAIKPFFSTFINYANYRLFCYLKFLAESFLLSASFFQYYLIKDSKFQNISIVFDHKISDHPTGGIPTAKGSFCHLEYSSLQNILQTPSRDEWT